MAKEYRGGNSSMDNRNKRNQLSHYELCLKEFKICGILTSIYIIVCCLLCWVLGYHQDGSHTTFIFGIPTWAVIGVFIPWILMVIITTIYGLFIMKGDEE